MSRRFIFAPKRFSYYKIIQPFTIRHYDFFDTTEARFGLRLLIPDGIISLVDYDFVLEQVFAQFLNDLISKFQVCVNDRLRLVFNHPFMQNSSVSMPLIYGRHISARGLLNFIEGLLRSGESLWIFDGLMIVNLTLFRNPQGEGSASAVNAPRKFKASDRSGLSRAIVSIRPSKYDPDGNLCCSRAIVVSVSKTEDSVADFKAVSDSTLKLQCDLARQLHKDAGVPFGPCGLPEIDKFQQLLAARSIQLIAFNANANRAPMNESPHFPKLAAILHDDGHFDAVVKPHRIVGKDARCGGK